jgi:hypothetical protein
LLSNGVENDRKDRRDEPRQGVARQLPFASVSSEDGKRAPSSDQIRCTSTPMVTANVLDCNETTDVFSGEAVNVEAWRRTLNNTSRREQLRFAYGSARGPDDPYKVVRESCRRFVVSPCSMDRYRSTTRCRNASTATWSCA